MEMQGKNHKFAKKFAFIQIEIQYKVQGGKTRHY
jgi:hypothetical protein